MDRYDPNQPPQPAEWLALKDDERKQRCRIAHEPPPAGHPLIKKPELHAAIHTVVETRAGEERPGVPQPRERLQRAGLPRHEASHAVGEVAVEFMRRAIAEKKPFDPEQYALELSKVK